MPIIVVTRGMRFFSQNSFYTTAANRMSRHLFPNAITNEDVIALCRENGIAATRRPDAAEAAADAADGSAEVTQA